MNKLLLIIFAFAAIALVVITFFQDNANVDEDNSSQNYKYEGWDTDLQVSLNKSKESKKNIMMLFTGSDWCPPCKLLDRNVVQSDLFKKYASENLELLFLDFPRNKKMDDAQIEHNNKLSEKYQIDGYPTILILNSNEVEIARMSYYGEYAGKFIERYEEKLKVKSEKLKVKSEE